MKLALIVLLCQIGFIFLRTVNVKATAKDQLWLAILSGIGIGTFWLLTTTISVTSANQIVKTGLVDASLDNWLAIGAHIGGGVIGGYMGMRGKDTSNRLQSYYTYCTEMATQLWDNIGTFRFARKVEKKVPLRTLPTFLQYGIISYKEWQGNLTTKA